MACQIDSTDPTWPPSLLAQDDPEATPRASGIETETGEAAAPSSASLPLARRERRKSITAGRERVDCRVGR